MANFAAREELAQLLSTIESTGRHSAQRTVLAEGISLEIEGYGEVSLPVRASVARKLIAHGQQAPYGQGTQTLEDTSVRDTWQIPSDKVSLTGAPWSTALAKSLKDFASKLGMPAGTELEAELHSFLIYGEGQFFLPHQDSEKHPEMVGTLVVLLPSTHSGGELVIDDGGEAVAYRAKRKDLNLVAFYADRRHEVRPVQSGYRLALTFNLLRKATSVTAGLEVAHPVAQKIREHFSTENFNEFSGRSLGQPERLAFLLDHEYTQRSLIAGALKGTDAKRVDILRAAAAKVDCELLLGQVQIREIWQTESDDGPWNRSWGHDYDDYDSGEDAALDYLIDDEITLDWWTAGDGSAGARVNLSLDHEEICHVVENQKLEPFEEEYEGYMGNYGNTADLWYRRTAAVLIPAEHAFKVRAEANPAWALDTLSAQINAGNLVQARSAVRTLGEGWVRTDPTFLGPALEVAVGIQDEQLAHQILSPFGIPLLGNQHWPQLMALSETYPDTWWAEQLQSWSARRGKEPTTAWITAQLLPLTESLRNGGSSGFADRLAEHIWLHLSDSLAAVDRAYNPSARIERMNELGAPLSAVLESLPEGAGLAVVSEVLPKHSDKVQLLVATLRASTGRAQSAMGLLAQRSIELLEAILQVPARASDDYSIQFRGCGCEICEELASFLGAADRQTFSWPLAQGKRDHVEQQVQRAELPVATKLVKQGRPYILELRKTRELFTQEQKLRKQRTADLDWLRQRF